MISLKNKLERAINRSKWVIHIDTFNNFVLKYGYFHAFQKNENTA